MKPHSKLTEITTSVLLNTPKVTVLVPAYNSQAYLREALDSICRQSYEDFECVVVNDGSTDDTRRILEVYVERDNRFRVIDQTNQGIAGALNTGLGEAKGEYIAEMDHDDVSMVHRLKLQADFLDAHPEVVLVAGGVELIDADGSFLGVDHPPLNDIDIRQSFFCGNPLHHGSVMYRKAAIQQVGGYRDGEAVRYIHDFDLWLRFAEVGQFAAIPQVVFRYRIHPNAITASFRQSQDTRIKGLVDALWEASTPPTRSHDDLRTTLRECAETGSKSYSSALQRRVISDQIRLAKALFRRGHWGVATRLTLTVATCGKAGFQAVLASLYGKFSRTLSLQRSTVETPWSRARERWNNPGEDPID